MAGTTIASSITAGISLTSGGQNPVTIASSGTVKVLGVGASAIYAGYATPGTIVNAGMLAAAAGYGVRLLAGGSVTNGGSSNSSAVMTGALYGIKTGARGAASISNFGTIANTRTTAGMGVFALGAASVINGSDTNTGALISGYASGVRITGAGGSISNFGTMSATGLFGSAAYLRAGGSVTNGSAADSSALLSGQAFGVEIQHGIGTVTNFGIIQGTGATGRGVVLQAGGKVVNGSVADTSAKILASNRAGVYIGGTIAGSVANYGTIMSVGPSGAASNGIAIRPGGTVTNGSTADITAAIIATKDGVYLQGLLASAVSNFGTIQSLSANGVNLYLGGDVTNGSQNDKTALITGLTGIYDGGASTITNFATISGSTTAINLNAGGSVINGGTADTVALIAGGVGIADGYGPTAVTNFGTIAGTIGSALALTGGGLVVNGGTSSTIASIIAAGTGVLGGSATSLSNFGTIAGGTLGVALNGGGSVINGGTANTKAAISGGSTGVAVGGVQASVMNFGTIAGASGIGAFLTSGGTVVNGGMADTTASIKGAVYGVRSGLRGNGTVVNFGTIANTSTSTGMGVVLFGNGGVVNGSATSTAAGISGFYAGVEIRGSAASVSNFGRITAISTLGAGVYLTAGGSVINGGTTATAASITGAGTGVKISHLIGTVANFGTIKGIGPYGRGVVLAAGGSVVNGSLTDTVAYISATDRAGVYAGDTGPSFVTNFGTIRGLGPTTLSSGLAMRSGGTVTNGAITDTKASISGSKHGVYIQGGGMAGIVNFGTISSGGAASIAAYTGGTITNGSSADLSALITGPTGVYLGGSGTIANFGTITGTGGQALWLRNGGTVVNGSEADKTALINAASATGSNVAVYDLAGPTTITNFGTIRSLTAAAIWLNTDGMIVNGSATDKTATINGSSGAGIYLQGGTVGVTNYGTISGGNYGISFAGGTVSAAGTVVNAGTISNSLGSLGVAVQFGTGGGRVVALPGAVFTGTVAGGGSTVLELGSGSGMGSIGGIGTSFSGIGSVVADAGGSWTLGRINSVANMLNNGTMFIAPSATLQVTGSVDAASTGIFQLNAGSVLEIAANTGAGDQIRFLGTGQLIIDKAASFGTTSSAVASFTNYVGPLIGSFVAGDKIDLKDVAFAGTIAASAVSVNYNSGTGLLSVLSGGVTKASLLFERATLGPGSFHAANDGAGHTLITHS
jgi:fibronectin-binding autotransporter adhesin